MDKLFCGTEHLFFSRELVKASNQSFSSRDCYSVTFAVHFLFIS